MVFHDGKMDGIPGRKMLISQDNLFCTFYDVPVYTQHLVHDTKQSVKRRLDGVAAVYGHVAVQDLLKNFGIREQGRPLTHCFFEQSSRVALARMGSADQIHRNIRVDQNHGRSPVP